MSLQKLSDSELIASFSDLVIEEQENLANQLEHLAELDRRKLFFGHSSLWAYLIEEKGFSDDQAVRRIRAARLIRRFPEILSRLKTGKLNLTHLEMALGCAHREALEEVQLRDLLENIAGLSTQKARREIATRYPREAEVRYEKIRPISAELSEVTFVADQTLLDQLDEVRGLLARAHPHLTLASLIGVLATKYREQHHPEERARRAEAQAERRKAKAAATVSARAEVKSAPPASARVETQPGSPAPGPALEPRFPPRPLAHALTLKRGYICSYIDPITGHRCTSTFALEIDHEKPWTKGGRTEIGNLRFLCRGHHARVTFLQFGNGTRFSSARG
jgi:hypothetical protein